MLVGGKRMSGGFDLTTMAIGRITVTQRNRPGNAKREAMVERMETEVVRVHFMSRRWGCFFFRSRSGDIWGWGGGSVVIAVFPTGQADGRPAYRP